MNARSLPHRLFPLWLGIGFLALTLVLTPPSQAQVPPVENAPPGTPSTASGSNTNAQSEGVQVSFQGADINMIVQWLAEQTGKSVIKHPQANCQITIVGAKKSSKRDAVNLVYRALALEGFTVIESSQSLLIVPEGKEPRLSPEFLDASQSNIPIGRQRLVKIFQLTYVQPAEMKEKIKPVLSEKGTAEVNDRLKQLIITDLTENINIAAELIKNLDSDRPGDLAVRVIALKNVTAQELVKEVGPLYQKMSGKSGGEVVEVAANERSNSLIILSSDASFKALERVVQSLDTEDALEKVIQPFTLKNADAEDVAKQLKDLLSDQDSSSRYPYFFFSSSDSSRKSKKPTVVADRRRNTIIVQASPGAMEGIKKMVATLDEAVGGENLAPKIYPLKFVSAVDIEDVLNQLFLKKDKPNVPYWYYDDFPQDTPDRDVGRLYGKVRITSEPYSNTIILTSNSAESLQAVEDVLKQLDVPSPAGESTFRVRLRFAKASTMANSLNILFAKGGSPPLRQNAPQPQPGVNPQQPQQQSAPSQTGFGLEQETREEGYFPWLGGQPDVARGSDGRMATRQVSDLVGRVRVVADPRSNSLLVSANVHLFPQIKKMIEDLDTPTAQVLIEARIIEVSTDFMDKLGVRWSPDGKQIFTAEDYDNSILGLGGGNYRKGFGGSTTARDPKADVVTAALGSMRSGVLDASINMDILVQFLRKNVGATVLAEPQINIEDNEVGKLFVGSQVPFIDKSQSTDVGSLNQSFSYKDVGIILEVIPHINIAGDVALKIRVESSAIEPGQTLFGGAILNTRNFKSDVTAKSGETLVLGGIIQKQTSDTVRKVPVLGSVPGLGWAFKKKDKVSRNVELLVFLRPRVVRTQEEARQLLEDLDKKSPQIQKLRENGSSSEDTKNVEKKGKS